MTYQEAKEYMQNVQKRGSIPGLTAVKNLLGRIHNPQNQLKVIHVAGTNGKGSICTFLEYLYREEGKKVGRYISPTLHCYLERFQINGSYMEEEEFAKFLSTLLPVIEEMEQVGEELPTAFEIETVIAFLYFIKQQADIVLLETGMGGREDATNVVDTPLCTVLASIGMDHMQFLGETIEEITYEKAGIMRDNCPAVIYPNSPEVMKVLRKQSALHNINNKICNKFYVVHKPDIQILSENLEGSVFLYKGEEYYIRMAGKYQIYNAATAIETKLQLDGSLLKDGLSKAFWEARFEKVSEHPLLIKDGAHNVDGVRALRESLQKHFTKKHLIFIIGVLRDKEYDKMMRILCPLATKVFTITPENERGLPGEVLKTSIIPYCNDVTVCCSTNEALEKARKHCLLDENAVIVAWGSLSYLGQLKK